jgi:hypothetical protein
MSFKPFDMPELMSVGMFLAGKGCSPSQGSDIARQIQAEAKELEISAMEHYQDLKENKQQKLNKFIALK